MRKKKIIKTTQSTVVITLGDEDDNLDTSFHYSAPENLATVPQFRLSNLLCPTFNQRIRL
jgi:hypothetical protein